MTTPPAPRSQHQTSVRCSFVHSVSSKQCAKLTRQGTRCHFHRGDVRVEAPPAVVKQDICPICLTTTQLQVFRCSHGVCAECRSSMRDFLCPLCRAFVAGSFPETELKLVLSRRVDDLASQRAQELGAQIVRAYQDDVRVLKDRYERELTSLRSAVEQQVRTLRGLISENQALKRSVERGKQLKP